MQAKTKANSAEDTETMELDDFEADGRSDDDAEHYMRQMSSIEEAREPVSMRRGPRGRERTQRVTLSKLELDRLLAKDVNMLDTGSFFDQFELGDVVSMAVKKYHAAGSHSSTH